MFKSLHKSRIQPVLRSNILSRESVQTRTVEFVKESSGFLGQLTRLGILHGSLSFRVCIKVWSPLAMKFNFHYVKSEVQIPKLITSLLRPNIINFVKTNLWLLNQKDIRVVLQLCQPCFAMPQIDLANIYAFKHKS